MEKLFIEKNNSEMPNLTSYMPAEEVVTEVKLLYFKNITLKPLRTQNWLNIPLNDEKIIDLNIDGLNLDLR